MVLIVPLCLTFISCLGFLHLHNNTDELSGIEVVIIKSTPSPALSCSQYIVVHRALGG